MMATLMTLADGAIFLAYQMIALFFLRFWTRSHLRLFAWFALAFQVLAVHRVVLSLLADDTEKRTPVYLGRLLAYMIILLAVVDHNRRKR